MRSITEQWIEGCEIQRIMFRDGLVLNFDEYNELVISVPLLLTLPPAGSFPVEVVRIDPHAVRDEERALFDMSGATCTYAAWDHDGDLHLELSDGHKIDVPHSDRSTSWELYGKYHGFAACLPHGKVHVIRHDIPDA
ncbi:DUF6188 family protein [Mycobacterium sp.]|jgi:hypothetical protein|uniref:DUF6188 family protein n=1 Tax=Mycobacterium sp. TaxID=1785 RepID=UPI002D29BB63|nr:DUF6188 family protein [Mycobacterium sp.]HZA12155.1 DUF6188 family protein [Mycobacterium sp.]